jgi:hypothetical protein
MDGRASYTETQPSCTETQQVENWLKQVSVLI